MTSPESSVPIMAGNVRVPPAISAGAAIPDAITAFGAPPGCTTHIALAELEALVNETTPRLLRKLRCAAAFRGAGVPLGTELEIGPHGPEVASCTTESPSLLPMKRPPQRLSSIWPLLFNGGGTSWTPAINTPPLGDETGVERHEHGAGGVSPVATTRTAGIPEGTT